MSLKINIATEKKIYFNRELAKQIGIVNAIVFEELENLIGDNSFIKISCKELQYKIDVFTQRQIDTAIKNLIKKNYIMLVDSNSHSMDRTRCIAIVEK